MQVEVHADARMVAVAAAAFVAARARAAVAVRGRFVFAVSGGQTPWAMMEALTREDMPWHAIHVIQTDERVALPDSPERNLTHLRKSLFRQIRIGAEQIHAMPVNEPDPDVAAAHYAGVLRDLTGSPPVIDLVHLGLGVDGHTASLVPGDPVVDVRDAEVAFTGVYQGTRRMTLTYPVLNRARQILFLVTGVEKAAMLARLRAGDQSIPAGRVDSDRVVIMADQAAAGCNVN